MTVLWNCPDNEDISSRVWRIKRITQRVIGHDQEAISVDFKKFVFDFSNPTSRNKLSLFGFDSKQAQGELI